MALSKHLHRTDAILLISFSSLCLPALLFILRFLDTNTLTSWRWVFTPDRFPLLVALLVLSTLGSLWASRISIPNRAYQTILFIGAFLSALPLWSVPEVILDAGRYFIQAKFLSSYGPVYFFREWGGAVPAWTDLPLIPFIYGVIFKVFGESRIVIQLFTTLIFSLSAVCTYRVGKMLWDEETGFLAGLLLLASPFLLVQVPLMLVDVPVLFFFSLSICAFLSAINEGGAQRCALAVLALLTTMLSKYSALPMLLVLPLITFVASRGGNREAIGRSTWILCTAALLLGILILAARETVQVQIGLLANYQWPGLGRWKEGFVSTFLFQVHPFVTIAAVGGACYSMARRDIRFLIPAWLFLFVLLFRADRIRYLIPLFPLLALSAGYGVKAMFSDQKIQRFFAFCAVFSALAIAAGGYLPFLNRTSAANLRNAAHYINSLPGNTVMVSALPQKKSFGNTEISLPLLDLYTRKQIIYAHDIITKPPESGIRTSPLRFTWEVPLPAFYDAPAGSPRYPVAIISSVLMKNLTLNDALSVREFSNDTGTFRYRTFVRVINRRVVPFGTMNTRGMALLGQQKQSPERKTSYFAHERNGTKLAFRNAILCKEDLSRGK